MNLFIKDGDAKLHSVYQDMCNVLGAMIYYNMVVFWGDVPYVTSNDWFAGSAIPKTDETSILNDLGEILKSVIEGKYLDEKKNESLKSINDYFFVSKDVARILLANIYMYQNNYAKAEILLKKVVNNGYYELDDSNYSKEETINNIWNNGSGREVIFAVRDDNMAQTGNSSQLKRLNLIPLMTYTDVILSYAECLHKNGKPNAENYLNQVISAKGITVSSGDVLTGIKEARKQLLLYSVGNFSFMKRNGIAKDEYGVESYRLLLPIPSSEIRCNPALTQNPGYI